MYKLLLLFAAVFSIALESHAQRTSGCSSMKYADKNQITPERLKLKKVAGRVVTHHRYPLSEGCVAIFDETSHKLIAVTELTRKGRFHFSNLPEGRYRLLVRDVDNFLCVANIPIEVAGREPKHRTVTVIMKPEAIDECSSFRAEPAGSK